jgi:hypothetical protein
LGTFSRKILLGKPTEELVPLSGASWNNNLLSWGRLALRVVIGGGRGKISSKERDPGKQTLSQPRKRLMQQMEEGKRRRKKRMSQRLWKSKKC